MPSRQRKHRIGRTIDFRWEFDFDSEDWTANGSPGLSAFSGSPFSLAELSALLIRVKQESEKSAALLSGHCEFQGSPESVQKELLLELERQLIDFLSDQEPERESFTMQGATFHVSYRTKDPNSGILETIANNDSPTTVVPDSREKVAATYEATPETNSVRILGPQLQSDEIQDALAKYSGQVATLFDAQVTAPGNVSSVPEALTRLNQLKELQEQTNRHLAVVVNNLLSSLAGKRVDEFSMAQVKELVHSINEIRDVIKGKLVELKTGDCNPVYLQFKIREKKQPLVRLVAANQSKKSIYTGPTFPSIRLELNDDSGTTTSR